MALFLGWKICFRFTFTSCDESLLNTAGHHSSPRAVTTCPMSPLAGSSNPRFISLLFTVTFLRPFPRGCMRERGEGRIYMFILVKNSYCITVLSQKMKAVRYSDIMLILNYFLPSLVTIKRSGPLIKRSFNSLIVCLLTGSLFYFLTGKKKARFQGAAGCSVLVLVHRHTLQPKGARNTKEKETENCTLFLADRNQVQVVSHLKSPSPL